MRTALIGTAAALLALLTVGCGGPSADLFVLERSGSIPGARLTMVVGDGGTVRCNGAREREISSRQLIDARAVAGDLNGDEKEPGPAREFLTLPPSKYTILRYRIQTEFGKVAFSDSSRPQPPVFFAAAKLARELAKKVCGLPR
ncbi:MAG: hypothetical protein F2813_01065 [Actinobacteria bacterium]|uniref:Unannotated protein n=1 Tax=freshwater metagenome TaxID=449393 RepID=A0A6J5ZA90_9ZZZZ|nr:hypothetical protein [Actinomycetota bacterium]